MFRICKHTSQELKQTTISWVIYLSICVTYEILNYPCTERKNKKFRSNTELRPSKYKLFCKHFITQVFLAILPNIPFSYFSKYLQSFLKWLSKGFGLLLLEDVTQPTFTWLKSTMEALCEICSKLTIKIPERRQWNCSGVFIVNFEQISRLSLLFYCLTWTSKCRPRPVIKLFIKTKKYISNDKWWK